MSITADGWFDWADVQPGPQARLDFYSYRVPLDLVAHHSQEGFFATYKAHLEPSRFPTMPTWHVIGDGTLIQLAPVFAATVHGHMANLRGPGGESDGIAPTPLTAAQVATWRRIHADLAAFTGRKPTRWTGRYGSFPPSTPGVLWLVEHRQMGPTGCPSERYAPLWAAIAQEEADMTPEERALLLKVASVLAGPETGAEFPNVASALRRFTELEDNDIRELLGLGLTQQRLGTHTHAGPNAGPTFPGG